MFFVDRFAGVREADRKFNAPFRSEKAHDVKLRGDRGAGPGPVSAEFKQDVRPRLAPRGVRRAATDPAAIRRSDAPPRSSFRRGPETAEAGECG